MPRMVERLAVDDAVLRSDVCPSLVLPDGSSPVLDTIKCVADDLPTPYTVDFDCPTILVCDNSTSLCVEPERLL